jgi:hypothetical protein
LTRRLRWPIQPAVTGQELNRQLTPHGLAFPIGHCATVPLSGYLLSGGLGWNSNRWGPACFSVEAADLVTADSSLVTANREHHADLLWAIRGGGPGFFAVVTQYHLRLYPAPRAIVTGSESSPQRSSMELSNIPYDPFNSVSDILLFCHLLLHYDNANSRWNSYRMPGFQLNFDIR